MASGALPSTRYRAQSLSKYQPKKVNFSRTIWAIRNGPHRTRWILYVFIFVLVVLLIPLPGLSSLRELLLDSLVPKFSEPRTKPARDVLRYIDPMIGTTNGGHVFPGATMPYGMAKPVADSVNKVENAAGYVEDLSLIKGFSQLHDSGMPVAVAQPFMCLYHILTCFTQRDWRCKSLQACIPSMSLTDPRHRVPRWATSPSSSILDVQMTTSHCVPTPPRRVQLCAGRTPM